MNCRSRYHAVGSSGKSRHIARTLMGTPVSTVWVAWAYRYGIKRVLSAVHLARVREHLFLGAVIVVNRPGHLVRTRSRGAGCGCKADRMPPTACRSMAWDILEASDIVAPKSKSRGPRERPPRIDSAMASGVLSQSPPTARGNRLRPSTSSSSEQDALALAVPFDQCIIYDFVIQERVVVVHLLRINGDANQ